jgi:hypothetical protein
LLKLGRGEKKVEKRLSSAYQKRSGVVAVVLKERGGRGRGDPGLDCARDHKNICEQGRSKLLCVESGSCCGVQW